MNVYRFGKSHIVWILQPDDDTKYSDFDVVGGVPRGGDWSSLGVKFVSDQLHPVGVYPDFNIIGHVPMFSPAAVGHFQELLSGRVEILPLRCASTELWALNVPVVDGAVDIDASEVTWFSPGRIMSIENFVFDAEVVAVHSVFRIPELSSQVFVNQDFVASAVGSGLTGIRADLVWSDGDGGPSSLPLEPERGRTLSAEELSSLDDVLLDDYLWESVCGLAGRGALSDLVAMQPEVRAFYITRLFEWEVGNGGLHQFFFNNPEPEIIEAVSEGYDLFGVPRDADVIRELVAPFSARESQWRESLRDGSIKTFFDSYPESQLDQFEDRVGHHDIERLAYVRAQPESFVI